MCASPSDGFDFLWDLLEEFEQEKGAHGNILGAPDSPDDEDLEKLKASMVFNVSQVNILPDAEQWWRENGAPLSSERRFQRLYHLLRRLDDFYSDKQVRRIKTDKGVLVVGARWWVLCERAKSGRGGRPATKPPFSVHHPFMHLRRGLASEQDWHVIPGKPITRKHDILRVGVCSLSGTSKTVFEPTSVIDRDHNTHGFRASGVETATDADHQDYLGELVKCVKWAVDSECHVLCLPELCVCEQGRLAMKAEIEKACGETCLIVPGSFHCPRPGENAVVENNAPVWRISRDGGGISAIEVTRAVKHERYDVGVDRLRNSPGMGALVSAADGAGCDHVGEHIAVGGRICVLETDVGVLGVVICKDMIGDDKFIDSCAQLVDHLLVVAMNPSPTDWFRQKAHDFLAHYQTATYYVNCSQMLPPGEAGDRVPLSFVCAPPLGEVYVRDVGSVRQDRRFKPLGEGAAPAIGAVAWSFGIAGAVRDLRLA